MTTLRESISNLRDYYEDEREKPIKNYKELCSILEVEVKTGKSKIIQLEKLKQWCDYEKVGHKFIIKGFKMISPAFMKTSKDELKILEDPRLYSNEYSEFLLYQEFFNKNKYYDKFKYCYIGLFSKNHLQHIFQYKNIYYDVYSRRKNELAERFNIPKKWMYDFFEYTNRANKGLVDTAMKRIKDNGFFNVEENILVGVPMEVVSDTKIERNQYGDIESNSIYDINIKRKRILTAYEGMVYEQCIAEAVEELNNQYENLDLSTSGKCKLLKYEEYIATLNKKTAKYLNLIRIHKEYRITMSLLQQEEYMEVYDCQEWRDAASALYQNIYRRDYSMYRFEKYRIEELKCLSTYLYDGDNEKTFTVTELWLKETSWRNQFNDIIARLISISDEDTFANEAVLEGRMRIKAKNRMNYVDF